MKLDRSGLKFAMCTKNDDYPASLEPRKIYQVVPDADATAHQLIRIIDESGEDYLYPANYFVPIKLPKTAEDAFSLAT